MHHHEPASNWLSLVFVISNLAIVAGYIAVPFTLLGRKMPMTRHVRIAGIFFFATCAVTHLSMAFWWPVTWLLIVNHTAQACAVWYFVIGFSRLIREAEVRRRKRAAAVHDPPGPVQP